MDAPVNPDAIYSTVNMALKHKNRRNSTSKRDKGTGKKPHGPPQRPPPTPPPAYTSKRTPPVTTPGSPQPGDTAPQSSPPPPTSPKPPLPKIAKKSSQLLAQLESEKRKKAKKAPPKPVPYHIYIKSKKMMGSSSVRGVAANNWESSDSDDSDSS